MGFSMGNLGAFYPVPVDVISGASSQSFSALFCHLKTPSGQTFKSRIISKVKKNQHYH